MSRYETMMETAKAREDELRRKLEEQLAQRNGTPTTSTTGAAGTVSKVALQRQARDNAAAGRAMTQLGVREWAPTDPVYAAGTRVVDLGRRNFEAEGRELAAVGPLTDNLIRVAEQIKAEDRRVVPVNVKDLRMAVGDDGVLVFKRRNRADLAGVPVTASAVEAVCDYFGATFGRLKAGLITPARSGGLDPDMKAEVFNRFIVDRVGKELTSRRNGDIAMVLRKQGERWQTFAVRSKRNTSNEFDGEAFSRLIATALDGSDYKGEAVYNPSTGAVTFSGWLMPNHIVDLSAGDVFKAGISGGTSDLKSGKFRIDFSVIRNLCLNLIILADDGAEVFSATHNSRADKVRVGIRDGLARADSAMDEFRSVWGILRDTPIPEVDDGGSEANVQAVLQEIAALARPSGVTRDATVEMLLSAWKDEPGDTWADVHNAVSRLHFNKEIDGYNLARKAGELLPILAQRATAEV